MRALFLALVFLFSGAFGVHAEALAPADKQAVTEVIDGQLKAFAADQGEQAYGYAAPIVKFAFPSVDNFMRMVREGYQPVYRNNGYEFGESFFDPMGRPAQRVVIEGTDGKNYEAIYFMEKQPDGSWLIAGCVIRVLQETNV